MFPWCFVAAGTRIASKCTLAEALLEVRLCCLADLFTYLLHAGVCTGTALHLCLWCCLLEVLNMLWCRASSKPTPLTSSVY